MQKGDVERGHVSVERQGIQQVSALGAHEVHDMCDGSNEGVRKGVMDMECYGESSPGRFDSKLRRVSEGFHKMGICEYGRRLGAKKDFDGRIPT